MTTPLIPSLTKGGMKGRSRAAIGDKKQKDGAMKRSLYVLAAILCAASAFAAEEFESRPPLRSAPARFDTAHSYDVQSYELRIRLPFTNDSLYGHVRTSAISRQTGLAAVALNAAGMTVDSVKYNGRDTTFTLAASILTVRLPGFADGEHFTVDAYYRLGNRGSSRRGYYWYPRGYNAGTLHAVAYSMSEPQDARCWMPCFDEPWDKADSGCVFHVTVPDSYAVACNGLFRDTVRSGDKLTWHWEHASPIATYLMCFTASRFSFWADTAHTINAGAVPLNYFVWPEDSAQSRTVFATVPAMVRLLDSTFGGYPFDKYGMAAVYPFAFGGMEHQGMTTIHRNWILGNSQTGILHELAHMWFGDLVTCGTWADIWLNEGFASYLQVYYDAWLSGQQPGVHMTQRFSAALSGNANTYPIYDPPMNLLFDFSMEYAKGAWVVHGLRWVMGDPLFFPMTRAYADSFGYGAAVSTDLQRIAERHYGQPLDWFFDEWIHRAGHPKYATAVYYKTHPDSNAARVRINQTSTTGELYTMPLQLSCSTRAGISTATIWDSTATAGDFLVTDSLPVLAVTLDRDNWVLKEWGDSLPRLTSLTTVVKDGNSVIRAHWNRFATDTTIAGYNLYRGPSEGGPFLRLNAATITDTSYGDSDVNSGETWHYCVSAVNGTDTCFESHRSNVLSCTAGGIGGGPGTIAAGALALALPAPNPFSRRTVIRYQLSMPGGVGLRMYNAAGQSVRTIVDRAGTPGAHAAEWDGRDGAGRRVASGVYYVRLLAEGRTLVRALQLVK